MLERKEQKDKFYRDLVKRGISETAALDELYPLGCAMPKEQVEAWLRRFQMPIALKKDPNYVRLVNHFTLGADPEFVFVNRNNERIPANSLGFRTGRFIGADMNGRLAEIRPKPHRSALHVTGSILDSLRFMALLYPAVRPYRWVAGAYQHQDGLGGHVHFGRKQELPSIHEFIRTKEQTGIHANEPTLLAGLDWLMESMIALGCYPEGECKQRVAATEGRGNYGREGDVRVQSHGFEYRTFPSWLDNPWLAFTTLTMAKLIAHDVDLIPWAERKAKAAGGCLHNLLCYYKGRDDDAALALAGVHRIGWPSHKGGDFKLRWNISYGSEHNLQAQVQPGAVRPSRSTIAELFHAFLDGTPIPSTVVEPNWTPVNLPDGYYCPLDVVETTRQVGLGELLTDLCIHRSSNLEFTASDAGLQISSGLAKQLPASWRNTMNKIYASSGYKTFVQDRPRIVLGHGWREASMIPTTRKLLTCGVFPICHISQVQLESYQDWCNQRPTSAAATERGGRVLYNEGWNI